MPLFGIAKNDPFNLAREEFNKLRYLSSDEAAYNEALVGVIYHSQAAISKRSTDGDAHVILANAYMLGALNGAFSDAYAWFLSRAAAVIHEWKDRRFRTKSKEIGEKVYQGVLEKLSEDMPDWMGMKISGDIRQLHRQYYRAAISNSAPNESAKMLQDVDDEL